MRRIDLVFRQEDQDAHVLRTSLRDALHMLELPPRWEEIAVGDETPAELVGHPFPTVVIDGEPVSKAGAPTPSRAQIIVTLQEHIARR